MPTVPLLGNVADLTASQTAQVTVPLMPTGSIVSYAGSSAPSGWLICDGASLSTTTYASLFSVLGYSFGGSGSSFNLPDLRGRFVRYDDNMGNHGIAGVTPAGAANRDSGRAHGSAQTQTTAANGLAGTAAGQTQGTSNISLASGSAAGQSLGTTSVTLGSGSSSGTSGGQNASSSVPYRHYAWEGIATLTGIAAGTSNAGGGTATLADFFGFHSHGYTGSASGSTNIAHTHGASSATGTTNIAHTHAASALTINGDTETRPINISLNAIIKI